MEKYEKRKVRITGSKSFHNSVDAQFSFYNTCSSHFVSSCLSEMLGLGLVSGLFLRLGFTLGYCFFLFVEKRVRLRVLDHSWLYSSPQAILKLSQSARRQFVTVTEGGVSVHLITCIPGYICSCLEHTTWQILS